MKLTFSFFFCSVCQEKAAKAADAARKRRKALSEAGGAPPPPPRSMKVVFKDGKLVVNDADLVSLPYAPELGHSFVCFVVLLGTQGTVGDAV